MPMLGSANHWVTERNVRTAAVATVADPNTISRRFALPPSSDIHRKPAMRDIRMIAGIAIVGSASQSFIRIAPYCFSSTATQKIGSEKKRNETSVTL